MDFLSNLIIISQPTGVWASIINAFENGVGSYLLAITLITIIVRILLAPLDTVNKRISKKQTDAQAKIQPEIEKLQKKYGNDRALLNQKTQELYKKMGVSVGGSCLCILAFLAINMTVFFTLFSALNGMADYKINQQYLTLKNNYANSLNLIDKYYSDENITEKRLINEYENVEIIFKDNKVIAYIDEEEIYSIDYINDFAIYSLTEKSLNSGDISEYVKNYNEFNKYTNIQIEETVNNKKEKVNYYILTEDINVENNKYLIENNELLYKISVTNDEYIYSMIREYISKENIEDGETPLYTYIGDDIVLSKEGVDIPLKDVVNNISLREVNKNYDEIKNKEQFLWIKNIWVADSPFKSSIFTFEEYKNEIGANNVTEQEEIIYNSFMTKLKEEKGQANGYFILAIISIGVSFLAIWLGQLGTKKSDVPNQKSNVLLMFIMPIIMGIFAMFYNTVFAIYLIVGQLVSAALTPLNKYIIKVWDKFENKKKEAKNTVVDYRRKD